MWALLDENEVQIEVRVVIDVIIIGIKFLRSTWRLWTHQGNMGLCGVVKGRSVAKENLSSGGRLDELRRSTT